jgi:ribonucleoside-diphosphate reductase beta chain
VSPVLVGYDHFLEIADRLAWDEKDVDLAADTAHWPRLDPERRELIAAFVAGFALAEERVAVDLCPFADAATDVAMADCFGAQGRDEERHARFFGRYLGQVLGVADARDRVAPRLAELFEERLGAAARELASGRMRLAEAVALYHLILEGVVFSAGQNALLEELQKSDDLPGLREGLERVVADERWHIGLGVRLLGSDPAVVTPMDAEHAIGAWGELLSAERRKAALRLHVRRLSAAGLRP